MITHTVLRLGRSCRSRRASARSAGMTTSFRVERDSMGEIKVPADALWGAHTQRAVQNFPVSGLTMPRPFIGALGLVKQAAARVNRDLKLLEPKGAQAVEAAAACFTRPSAPMKGRGMVRPPTGEVCTPRWGCAPHSASAGTLISPLLARPTPT